MPRLRPSTTPDQDDRVVISGMGMIASVGNDRESVWRAVRQGTSGVRRVAGLPGVPEGLSIAALADVELEFPGQLKVIALALHAAAEAIEDSHIDLRAVDCDRFGCAVSGHMGDAGFVPRYMGRPDLFDPDAIDWWQQWFPSTGCWQVATRFGLHGPRTCHSTACASGLIDFLAAVRLIRDGQCDLALAGSAEAVHPLFAAGFERMRVLAHHEDPALACRPFDRQRSGFVMGEGAAMFVVERLDHALRRGAPIYAEVMAGKMQAEAHHLTGVDVDAEGLAYMITETLRAGRLAPDQIRYINAHGTGTQQNDVMETRGIRRALGPAAERTGVSSTKSMLGHLVNAAGSVELAVTTLALRDGFAPPTINLTDPDPECDLDCIPLVGRTVALEHALKVSVAFGGHMAAVALRRWPDCRSAPLERPARAA
ncbi:MAG: beta-ketoacyl-[acyl-carrier-protein] synthase family protein [Planctomycetes bacterium]|nr:beta-ketoacyl-[acyl-carrier-protein] synthase family protein [Planctomycetota bacterium]